MLQIIILTPKSLLVMLTNHIICDARLRNVTVAVLSAQLSELSEFRLQIQ